MMDYLLIVVTVGYFISSHLIAQFIGARREIGYGTSVFYSVLFTPIIGVLLTLFSKKMND